MDVNLLRKDAPSQKYIILHDAIANQPFGVSLWETGLENMNEWFVQWSWHLKQKEHMSYWQATYVVFPKPLFEKSDGGRVLGRSEEWMRSA